MYDVKRLEMYAQNLVDYHLVLDLLPEMAKLYFTNKLGEDMNISLVQSAILIGMGLQHKSVEDLEKELQLPPNQLLAMFNKIVKKYIALIENKNVSDLSKKLFVKEPEAAKSNGSSMQPLEQSLEEELEEASRRVQKDEQEKKRLLGIDFKQYEIKGSEKEWTDALKLPPQSSYVTIKRYFPRYHFQLSKPFLTAFFLLNRMNEKRKIDFESHFDDNNKEHNSNENTSFKNNDKKKHKNMDKNKNKNKKVKKH